MLLLPKLVGDSPGFCKTETISLNFKGAKLAWKENLESVPGSPTRIKRLLLFAAVKAEESPRIVD